MNYIFGTYFPESAYLKKYDLSDIPGNKLTHLFYSVDNSTLSKEFTQNIIDDLVELKSKYPSLKVILSIGGKERITSATRRVILINIIKNYMATHNFDGVNIAWENPLNKRSAKGTVQFLKGLKSECPNKLICYSLNPLPYNVDITRPQDFDENVDFFILNCYNFSGYYSTKTLHHTNLHKSNAKLSVSECVDDINIKGVPLSKMVLCCPTFAIGFEGTNGVGDEYNNTRSDKKYIFEYKNINSTYESYDNVYGAGYSYDPNTKEFLSYDNVESVSNKCDYVKTKGMGGVMTTNILWDFKDTHPRSLTNCIYNKLNN